MARYGRKLRLFALATQAFIAALLGQSVSAQSNDVKAWERAKRTDTPSAYDEFLRAHPDSRYAREAFEQVVRSKLEQKRPEFYSSDKAKRARKSDSIVLIGGHY